MGDYVRLIADGKEDEAVWLVDNKLNPNFVDEEGSTPLSYAVRAGMLKLAARLLQRGADPNVQVSNQHTDPILFLAVFSENADMIRLLIQHHANVNQPDRSGRTALTISERQRTQEISDILRQ